jgi:hypothetical protein
MRILIEPPQAGADVHLASEEVRKALVVLAAAYIKTDGGGTIESDQRVTGVIVIKSDEDAPKAIEVLTQMGIKAAIG